jgi:hypothetical protein
MNKYVVFAPGHGVFFRPRPLTFFGEKNLWREKSGPKRAAFRQGNSTG